MALDNTYHNHSQQKGSPMSARLADLAVLDHLRAHKDSQTTHKNVQPMDSLGSVGISGNPTAATTMSSCGPPTKTTLRRTKSSKTQTTKRSVISKSKSKASSKHALMGDSLVRYAVGKQPPSSSKSSNDAVRSSQCSKTAATNDNAATTKENATTKDDDAATTVEDPRDRRIRELEAELEAARRLAFEKQQVAALSIETTRTNTEQSETSQLSETLGSSSVIDTSVDSNTSLPQRGRRRSKRSKEPPAPRISVSEKEARVAPSEAKTKRTKRSATIDANAGLGAFLGISTATSSRSVRQPQSKPDRSKRSVTPLHPEPKLQNHGCSKVGDRNSTPSQPIMDNQISSPVQASSEGIKEDLVAEADSTGVVQPAESPKHCVGTPSKLKVVDELSESKEASLTAITKTPQSALKPDEKNVAAPEAGCGVTEEAVELPSLAEGQLWALESPVKASSIAPPSPPAVGTEEVTMEDLPRTSNDEFPYEIEAKTVSEIGKATSNLADDVPNQLDVGKGHEASTETSVAVNRTRQRCAQPTRMAGKGSAKSSDKKINAKGKKKTRQQKPKGEVNIRRSKRQLLQPDRLSDAQEQSKNGRASVGDAYNEEVRTRRRSRDRSRGASKTRKNKETDPDSFEKEKVVALVDAVVAGIDKDDLLEACLGTLGVKGDQKETMEDEDIIFSSTPMQQQATVKSTDGVTRIDQGDKKREGEDDIFHATPMKQLFQQRLLGQRTTADPSDHEQKQAEESDSKPSPKPKRRRRNRPDRFGEYTNDVEETSGPGHEDTVQANDSNQKKSSRVSAKTKRAEKRVRISTEGLKETMVDAEKVEGAWSEANLENLRKAHKRVDPRSYCFWDDVSEILEGERTAGECRDKWFSLVKTPIPNRKPKRQRVAGTGVVADVEHSNSDPHLHIESIAVADDDIFNATPMRKVVATLDDENELCAISKMDLEGSAIKIKERRTVDDDASAAFSAEDTEAGEPVNRHRHQAPRGPPQGYKMYLQSMRRTMKRELKAKRKKKTSKVASLKLGKNLSEWADEGDVEMNCRLSPGGTLQIRKSGYDDDEDVEEDEECNY